MQAPTCQAGSVRAETPATPEQLQQQAVNQRQQALQLQQDTVDRLLAAEASLAEDEAGVTPPEAQQRWAVLDVCWDSHVCQDVTSALLCQVWPLGPQWQGMKQESHL